MRPAAWQWLPPASSTGPRGGSMVLPEGCEAAGVHGRRDARPANPRLSRRHIFVDHRSPMGPSASTAASRTGRIEGMRITAIKAYPAWVGTRNQLLVKVETDEGVCGWGESGLSG